MGIVERMQCLCKNAGTSLAALEKDLGFGKGTMYRWEEKIPAVDKVQKVAAYFGVSVDYLLGRNDNDVSGEQKDAAEIDDATLDAELITMLTQLDPSEIQRVTDFVSGILASRRV